jgi:hypothetical protein
VTALEAPASVKVPAGGSVTQKLSVEVTNLSTHSERILDLTMLGSLVTLDVSPTGMACSPAGVALDPKSGKKLPLDLEPGKKLKVSFTATFDCADTDYLAEARVDHSAIDGSPDSVPSNDVRNAAVDAVPK